MNTNPEPVRGHEKLLEVGDALSASIGAYALALARRQDGDSSDDSEITIAIGRCVQAKKTWDILRGEKP